ncbi:adenylate/guanylate cyclase domain-containing protein [Reyranella sp.]|uniref:AAA family ATPase n=1 Tax=Reyranella sp. TaxID=1929291 RepID=UPI0012073A88|nr:adenylate/guanylate cyclase domain-containing protein [Reyranella sp.]TAJ85317.1 MAG: hypothetical protein EPO50_16675 [Reyranella sp.]
MIRCAICGTENLRPTRLCGNCGNALQLGEGHGPAERRHVTVLFCDLVASTSLSQEIDAEDFGEILVRYRNIVAESAERHGGHLTRFYGDGAMLCFGYPTAHEDDTVNAVRCGHHIVDSMKSLDYSQFGPISWTPAARVGIHTGLTLVGDLGFGELKDRGNLIGEVPNLAARIQQQAPKNGIVMSSITRRLIESRIDCRPLGLVQLPGTREPIALFESLGVRTDLDDPLQVQVAVAGPPIGRDAEYNLIVSRWELARAGNGQIGVLVAEAGMGKTHLIRAVAAQALGENARLLIAACLLETSGSVLHPIASMIRRELGLSGLDVDQAMEALRAALAPLGGDEPTAHAVATLLGFAEPEGSTILSTSVNRAQAFALIAEWIVAAADNRPTLFVVEDLHLADPSTRQFLAELTDRIAGASCLLLGTMRPSAPPLWDHRSHGFTLHLGRLPSLSVVRLIESVTRLMGETGDREVLSDDAIHHISQRSDGVPLYIAEITKEAIENRQHGLRRNGTLELVIPPTLQELLLSRLDRLGPAKPIAQLASCLGSEFGGELLAALHAGNPADLREFLDVLVSAEIIIRHGLSNNARLSFRHSLFQEIAYNSLLRSQRRAYHAQIAKLIPDGFPSVAEKKPEILARHCAEGGMPELAIQHWRKAAHLAYSSSGFVEAVDFLHSALDQLPYIAPEATRIGLDLALQVDLGTALIATRGEASPEVEQAYSRAEMLLQRNHGKELSFSALRGLQAFYQVRGPLRTSHQLCERLNIVANTTGDPIAKVEALRRLGWCLFCKGDLIKARDHLHEAIELYSPRNAEEHIIGHSVDPLVLGRINLAWLEAIAGDADKATREANEAIRYGSELGHGLSLAYGLGISAAVYQTLGDAERAEQYASETLTLARRRHLPYWISFGTLMKGWSRAASGAVDGLVELDAGLKAYRATGARLFVPYALALKAEAMLRSSRAADAQNLLTEALREASELECRFATPQIMHLAATCALQMTKNALAVAPAFDAALSEALSIGAGQLAERVLSDAAKAEVWTSQEIAALRARRRDL